MASQMEDGEETVGAVSSLCDCACDGGSNRVRKYRREHKFEEKEG